MHRVSRPIIGSPILGAPESNGRELLAFSVDRLVGSMNPEWLVESFFEQGDGQLARMVEGVFHAHGEDHVENNLESTCVYCDAGSKSKEE